MTNNAQNTGCRPVAVGGEEAFSGGVRRWYPLNPCADLVELVDLNWSLARPALDNRGRLVQVLEVPVWRQGDAGSLPEQASEASARLDATDAAPAPELLVGSGIEMDDGAYRLTTAGRVIRWEFSADLGRLRGRLCVAPDGSRCCRFAQYLLRLNWDLRFIRVGYAEAGIALQAVLPGHDRRWLAMAEGALTTLCDVLQPQFAWWRQPRWLVDDLFNQVDRGPKNERNSK